MGRAAVVLLVSLAAAGAQRGVGQEGADGGYLDVASATAQAWLLDEDASPAGHGHERRVLQQQSALSARHALLKRCRGTTGFWCGVYDAASPLPLRPAPRGSRACPGNCSGVGNCNFDTGTCDCPAGSQGPDCGTILLRPCTTHFGDGTGTPAGHIDDEGRDLRLTDPGYTESRCTGICDPLTARCFCDGKHRRVNPPKGSPPGTPAPVRGRPLGNHMCQVSDDGQGHKLEWGQVAWDKIYGPDGWCNSDKPVIRCPCLFDGFSGELCDEMTENMCPNQCSGHGECDSGFCKCHAGWYGTDCARKAAGEAVAEPGVHESGQRPWLRGTVRMPAEAAAAAGGAAPVQQRRRPLIYVYDLPPAYNTRMLQYRNDKGLCTWRAFNSGNRTEIFPWTYGIEVLFHEMLLQSDHRTFDPEQADFFYMPVYSSCFIFPIHCYADGPWWHAPSGPRVMHVTNMMLEARDWVRKHFPYYDRRGGRDHVWFMTHDEGACYAPTEIYNTSIFLTHWGRTDAQHASHTAFTPDNYTQEFVHPLQPGGWLRLIAGHPCYTPGKDLVVPALKLPFQYGSSPLMLHPPRRRDILLYLRGDVGKHRLPNYSRGIRQRLYKLWKEQRWKERYNILIGDGGDVPGPYSEHLASSKFCVVAPGDGWSPRLEDAALHGCVPVLLMDGVRAVWEEQLDFGAFAVRVPEAELEGLPARLAAVPEAVLDTMQRRLRAVWHRFAYLSHPLLAEDAARVLDANLAVWARQEEGGAGAGAGAAQRRAEAREARWAAMARDDAFHTVLQWLAARIPATR